MSSFCMTMFDYTQASGQETQLPHSGGQLLSLQPHERGFKRQILCFIRVDNFTASSILNRFSGFRLSSLRPMKEGLRGKYYISFGWTTLLHPPYSADLAASDYRIFGPMKEGLRGKHASDKEMKSTVIKWLKEQSTEFYEAGSHALIRRWNIAIERNGDHVIHRGPASF